MQISPEESPRIVSQPVTAKSVKYAIILLLARGWLMVSALLLLRRIRLGRNFSIEKFAEILLVSTHLAMKGGGTTTGTLRK